MTSYIIRRLLQTIVVLLLLSFGTFSLLALMPGDPHDIACAADPHCTPETLEQMKKNLGLDRPIYERYAEWLQEFLQGNFGYSRTYRQPVADIIMPRLANTMILSISALLLSLVIALPIGVYSSLKDKTKTDYAINFVAFLGISIPSFWLGIILIMTFSVYLSWFPSGGTYTVEYYQNFGFWEKLADRSKYLFLPTLSLAVATIANWTRYTRASMLETMRLDFIRTAKAKGLSYFRVVVHHGFRNALIPIVTVVAVSIGFVFSGAIITETVFAYQGTGYLMLQSVLGNDYNVAMASFVITCSMVLIMNLIADIGYAYLDPRIRYV